MKFFLDCNGEKGYIVRVDSYEFITMADTKMRAYRNVIEFCKEKGKGIVLNLIKLGYQIEQYC